MNHIQNSNVLKNIMFISFLLLLWYLISISSLGKNLNGLWFADIRDVFLAMKDVLSTRYMYFLPTFELMGISIIIVIILGVGVGVLIGYFDGVYKSIDWSIDFWRSIPPVIVIFIFYNLDNFNNFNEEYWRIWLTIFGTLPIMIMQIADAIIAIPKERMLMFNALNINFWFKIQKIVFYEILPSLFSTTRTIISFSIIIIIVSEMIISPDYVGIGGEILHFKTAYQIDYVYAYIIVIGFIGFIINKFIRYTESKIITWGP